MGASRSRWWAGKSICAFPRCPRSTEKVWSSASDRKLMAKLNIAERRLPQDGRIKIKVVGREVDLRVSTLPTLYGESVVISFRSEADGQTEYRRAAPAPGWAHQDQGGGQGSRSARFHAAHALRRKCGHQLPIGS